jgi:hypothetical protein
MCHDTLFSFGPLISGLMIVLVCHSKISYVSGNILCKVAVIQLFFCIKINLNNYWFCRSEIYLSLARLGRCVNSLWIGFDFGTFSMGFWAFGVRYYDCDSCRCQIM